MANHTFTIFPAAHQGNQRLPATAEGTNAPLPRVCAHDTASLPCSRRRASASLPCTPHDMLQKCVWLEGRVGGLLQPDECQPTPATSPWRNIGHRYFGDPLASKVPSRELGFRVPRLVPVVYVLVGG